MEIQCRSGYTTIMKKSDLYNQYIELIRTKVQIVNENKKKITELTFHNLFNKPFRPEDEKDSEATLIWYKIFVKSWIKGRLVNKPVFLLFCVITSGIFYNHKLKQNLKTNQEFFCICIFRCSHCMHSTSKMTV